MAAYIMSNVKIREANKHDIHDIMKIQRECYPSDLVEPSEVFVDIISDGLCVVAEAYGTMVGFLLAHLSPRDHVHLLHQKPMKMPPTEESTCIFIHDCSVSPGFRGKGIGSAMVATLKRKHEEETACKYMQLMAVNGAQSFWEKNGFTERKDIVMAPEVILNYGGYCSFMDCHLKQSH